MCDNFNDWARENLLLPKTMALVGGLLCGIGWFLYIDGTAKGIQIENDVNGTTHQVAYYSWIPALFGTIAFIMSVHAFSIIMFGSTHMCITCLLPHEIKPG